MVRQVVANLRMGDDVHLNGNKDFSTLILEYGTTRAVELVAQLD